MAGEFNKFQCFVGDLGLEVHNLNTDTLRVMLTLVAPVATNTIRGNLTEIANGGGYTTGGIDAQNVWSASGGTGTLTGTDVVWTADGATFADFRYAVLYNDTATNDPLICWWDYDSTVDLADDETFTVAFGANILTLPAS